MLALRLLMFAGALLCSLGAAPTTARVAARGPAPRIESSGPLRVSRYTRPFTSASTAAGWSYHEDRYFYSTPTYGYCGYYGYGSCFGWRYYGCGYGWGYFSSRPTTGVAPSGAYSPGW